LKIALTGQKITPNIARDEVLDKVPPLDSILGLAELECVNMLYLQAALCPN
jgi:hypothetical protein